MAGTVHIYVPSGARYIAQWRPRGHRKWRSIGNWSRSKKVALRNAAVALTEEHECKRARVLWMAPYYDPEVWWEMNTRC